MVAGQIIRLEPRGTRPDRYGRLIAEVFVDGQSLNEALLSAGFAWHYVQYDHTRRLAALEQEARVAKRGLWQDVNPTPPWEWRQNRSRQGVPANPDHER